MSTLMAVLIWAIDSKVRRNWLNLWHHIFWRKRKEWMDEWMNEITDWSNLDNVVCSYVHADYTADENLCTHFQLLQITFIFWRIWFRTLLMGQKKKNTPNLTVKIHTGYTQLATPTDTLCTPLLTYSIFLFDFIYVAPCSLKGQSWEVNADTLLWLYLTLPLLYNDINGAIKWVAPIHREGGASGVHKTHRTPTERERERASGRALNYPKWKQFSFTAITHSSLLQSSSPLSEHFPHYIFYHDTLIPIVVQREPRGL